MVKKVEEPPKKEKKNLTRHESMSMENKEHVQPNTSKPRYDSLPVKSDTLDEIQSEGNEKNESITSMTARSAVYHFLR